MHVEDRNMPSYLLHIYTTEFNVYWCSPKLTNIVWHLLYFVCTSLYLSLNSTVPHCKRLFKALALCKPLYYWFEIKSLSKSSAWYLFDIQFYYDVYYSINIMYTDNLTVIPFIYYFFIYQLLLLLDIVITKWRHDL